MMSDVNHQYKDRLFRKLFGVPEQKQNLLSLYNALNDTQYTNPDEIKINTLEDVIFMEMKNDVSCVIDGDVVLLEHQSSWNPNMPLRGFMYFAKLYSKYVEGLDDNIYGSKQITIPTPQFFVLYNGNNSRIPGENKERIELKLSDAFAHPPRQGTYEWTASVININYGHNSKILDSCRTLKEYALFVSYVNENRTNGLDVETAVRSAVDRCIEEQILFPYLRDHKAEVIDVCITEYNEKKLLDSERRYGIAIGEKRGEKRGIEIGRAKGRAEGKAEERLNALRSIMDSLTCSADYAMNILKIEEDERVKLAELLEQDTSGASH